MFRWMLIGRFVKFEGLVAGLLDGLRKAGLKRWAIGCRFEVSKILRA
jgi:hypothetical protein